MRKVAPFLGALAWVLISVMGVLLLVAYPLGQLIVLAGALGLTQLAVFFVVEGMVELVRNLSPLRGTTWFKGKDAEIPDITLRAMGLEVAVSMVAAAVLIATSTLWQPVVHVVDVPRWLIAFIALRVAGTQALISMSVLRRPVAMLAVILDLAVFPLVALGERSLGGTVVVSTFITWCFVLLTAWMPAWTMPPSKKKKEKVTNPADENDR